MNTTSSLIDNILADGYLMSLGTLDENGVWVSDVVYIYDSTFCIYWISQVSTRHSVAISKEKKVSATITLSQQGEKNLGIQIEGTAEKINQGNLEMVQLRQQKKEGLVPHKTLYVAGKILDPELSWYKLTPTKIELINEAQFGFVKQVLELNK